MDQYKLDTKSIPTEISLTYTVQDSVSVAYMHYFLANINFYYSLLVKELDCYPNVNLVFGITDISSVSLLLPSSTLASLIFPQPVVIYLIIVGS